MGDLITQKLNVNGFDLAYKRAGSGETILLIHGITTNSFIWNEVTPFLEEKYDVIAIDLLGNGQSDKPLDVDYSLKNQSIIIRDFCTQLGLKKFHLVCHDVGGGIGQIFTVNYPELVKSLTLINSVAYDFWPVQPIIAMRTPIIRQLAMATLDIGMFKVIIKRGLYHKEKYSQNLLNYFWEQMSSRKGRKAFLHFAECLNNDNLMEIAEKIKEIDLPVLIIRCNGDVYLSKEISLRLKENIKNSVYKEIETAGHFAMIDEPELIATMILEFLVDA